jgi:sulfopyruvate decarboxylase TPP-binding subunit
LIPGNSIAALLTDLGITHVVWLPDSGVGPWEEALERSAAFALVRVCREGEAWAIAAGLHLGGARPMVIVQNTGLFESGDALRNVLFDMALPLFALVGYRSYLVERSTDSARTYTEPILRAWGLYYVLVDSAESVGRIAEHYRACQRARKPGVALIAEGRL